MDFKKTVESIGPIAGPIGSIASSLIGGLFSKSEGDKQREFAAEQNALNRQFQHDEAELAYNRNERTRILQNDYNSEESQVRRLKNAGINPYNAMSGLSGSSVTSSGNTASAGNASGSQMSYQQPNMQWISEIANIGLVAAQTKLMEAQARNYDSQSRNTDLNSDYQQMYNDIFRDYGRIQAKVQLDKTDAERGYYDAQASWTRVQESLSRFDLSKIKPQQLNNMVAQQFADIALTRLRDIQSLKTEAERDIAYKKLRWEISLMSSMYVDHLASAYYKRQQGDLAAAGVAVQGELAGLYRQQGQLTRWNAGNARLDYYKNQKLYNKLSDDFINTIQSQWSKNRELNSIFTGAHGYKNIPFLIHSLGSLAPLSSSPFGDLYNTSPLSSPF